MKITFGMFGNSAQWSEKLRFTDRNRLWTGNKYRAKIKAVNPPKAPPAKKVLQTIIHLPNLGRCYEVKINETK